MSTARKSENTIGITDKIFLLVIFNDGTNSVSNSVGIYRRIYSIGETVGIYWPSLRQSRNLFLKVATAWWRRFFQKILPMEISRDSNPDSRSATWHFHRWNHRRIYRRKVSVGDSIGKSQYMLTLPTLSSSVSPSSSPSHLSPLPSQTTTKHPSQLSPLLNTSTQVSYTFVHGHNIR